MLRRSVAYLERTLERASVTRWGQDEFARGSYSVVPVGASSRMATDLAEPEGRLLFAGEATAATDMQMVHGAFASGLAGAVVSVSPSMLVPVASPVISARVTNRLTRVRRCSC